MTEGTPFLAKVSGNGKVTIPKNVRDLHGVKDGDYVECAFIKVERGNGQPAEQPQTANRPEIEPVS
jgi:AbrB family looped-hinge helix DNA binding protein